ncbi:MAG: hypothetical protein P1U74_05590 [Legionellaceae bacterium]|nr:hypothetical protein [Legionellaceae bacterium]
MNKIQNMQPNSDFYYFFICGCIPGSRNKNLGLKVITPILNKSDSTNSSCYAEFTSSASLNFGEKNGFKHVDTIEVSNDLSIYTALRLPKSN